MDLNSLALRDLEATYVLTLTEENTKINSQELDLSRTSWQNKKSNNGRELVSTKEIISYHVAKSFVSIFLWEKLSPTFKAIPYFPIVSYYCGF